MPASVSTCISCPITNRILVSGDLSGKKLNQVVTVSLSATSLDSTWATCYNLSPEVQEMARNAYLLKDSHIFPIFWAKAAQELSEPEENLERKIFQPEEVYELLESLDKTLTDEDLVYYG